jgi:hypothetical protein
MLDRIALLESLRQYVLALYGGKHDETAMRLYEDFRCHCVGWSAASLLATFEEYIQLIRTDYAQRKTTD